MTLAVALADLATRIEAIGPNPSVSAVAEGGAGTVYCVRSRASAYALKTAFDDDRAAISRRRLTREAAVLDRLTVACVPSLVYVDPAGAFLLRSWVEGEPLASASTGVASAAIANVLRTAHDTMRVAHARGFVLRDFKPVNLIVGATATVHLVDVGSARRETEIPQHPDGRRLGTGKWLFMAPEQLYGSKHPHSSLVDVYSVAATIAWCVMRRLPYSNSERSPDLARQRYLQEWHLAKERLTAEMERVGLARTVAEFVLAGLHPDPAERPGRVPTP